MRRVRFAKVFLGIALGTFFTAGLLLWGQAAAGGSPQGQDFDRYISRLGVANAKPAGIGEIRETFHDGATDDLLTAGLGKTGLAAAAPAFKEPSNPTPAELRRNAIHTNYRAVLKEQGDVVVLLTYVLSSVNHGSCHGKRASMRPAPCTI